MKNLRRGHYDFEKRPINMCQLMTVLDRAWGNMIQNKNVRVVVDPIPSQA